jgi:uncharacterized YceG family protein
MGAPPPVPGGGRSEEERERARREREARRQSSGSNPTVSPHTPAAARTKRPPGSTHRRIDELRAARSERPPREPRSRRPVRQPGSSTGRRRIFVAVVGVAFIAVIWFLFSLFQPFAGHGGRAKTVTIKRNAGLDGIARTLTKEHIVSSEFFFKLRATVSGRRGDLKPGTYTLREDSSYEDILNTLAKGPPINTINVTVPEGRSRSEVAASIKDSGIDGDYEKATIRSKVLSPRAYGAKRAKNLEGFLFPATYELKRGQAANALVDKQLTTFKQRFASVSMRRAKSKNLSKYDVLIIASLVERETASPHERRMIASVIYNRLKNGTPLGIDATTRFEKNNWDKPLKNSDFASRSGYNTRTHTGLPPGPIGNPGLASIKAAANPARTPYLFYVVNPCKPTTHKFTRTLAEFNAAVARYNAARTKAGGKAPKGC